MENNKKYITNGWLAIIIVILILVIDQIIKIEVKTNMTLGEAIRITDWFYIDFIENNGMAYGMTFFNKLVLSLFRTFAIGSIEIRQSAMARVRKKTVLIITRMPECMFVRPGIWR